ncbi:probable carboxylesterase 18 [Ziziphus jujuba]|uniref:Probable carboxylesterase 18 n=1 Tax=Ziziphus jujuba TaxID=326968 RepID=A0A6P3ZLQ3_ZIZJJ|nr:probable carboxylesterase 18 [Ziziphus jujuba]
MSSSSVPSSSNSKPCLPWRTRLAVSFLSLLTDTARRPDGTINRRLLRLLDFKSSPTPTSPLHGVTSRDHTLDPSRNLWVRVFVPHYSSSSQSQSQSLPVIVFFHGGGFTFLDPASFAYDAVCRKFARKIPSIVVSVNYRLSPEHRYPCQYDDGFDVLKYLDHNGTSLLPEFADLSKCFLAGDSAGANLAHHVAVRAAAEQLMKSLKVVGLVSIQPFFGGEERTESEIRLAKAPLVSLARTDWLWKVFLPEGSNRDHPASNVSGPNAVDISGSGGYPDTLVFVGGLDPLQDWQRRYWEWLTRSGVKAELVEYPNMIHAFYVFPELPQAHQLITQVKHFVNAKCHTIDPS